MRLVADEPVQRVRAHLRVREERRQKPLAVGEKVENVPVLEPYLMPSKIEKDLADAKAIGKKKGKKEDLVDPSAPPKSTKAKKSRAADKKAEFIGPRGQQEPTNK